MRATSPNIKFVDVPNAVENNEVYLRFSDSECAKKYVSEQNNEDRQFVILEGDEEKRYWHKLKEDRERFEEKKSGQRRRKQRGRDKLIKRAEKEAAKHIFFEGKEGEDVNTAIPSM